MIFWKKNLCKFTVLLLTLHCISILLTASTAFTEGVILELLNFHIPRVETGKITFTVIPASRKRRRKGIPVVSGETVMYGYESSATLTTDRLHYKLQTRPLVTEGSIMKF
jgi:hypothetical protein